MIGTWRDPLGDPLLEALRTLTGWPTPSSATGKREAIGALVDDRARVLVVQRTGWGKSAVYFLTTHLLREQGAGPTLLISPLLALMRNQIDAAASARAAVRDDQQRVEHDHRRARTTAARRRGRPAAHLARTARQPRIRELDHADRRWPARADRHRRGALHLRLGPRLPARLPAHRTHRRSPRRSSVPILGCTATANDRVVNDVADQLGAELTTFRGSLRAGRGSRVEHDPSRPPGRAPRLVGGDAPGTGRVGHRLLPHGARRPQRRRLARLAGHRGRGVLRVARQRVAHRGRAPDSSPTRSRRSSPPPPSAWATTSPTSASSSTSSRRALRLPTTNRSAARVERSRRAAASCSRGIEDEQIQDWFIEQAFAEEHLVNDIVQAFDSFDGPVPLMRIQVKLERQDRHARTRRQTARCRRRARTSLRHQLSTHAAGLDLSGQPGRSA